MKVINETDYDDAAVTAIMEAAWELAEKRLRARGAFRAAPILERLDEVEVSAYGESSAALLSYLVWRLDRTGGNGARQPLFLHYDDPIQIAVILERAGVPEMLPKKAGRAKNAKKKSRKGMR